MSVKHVTCPACTLLCDDIDASDIANVVCDKAQSFFRFEVADSLVQHVAGQPASLDSSVQSAVEILQKSQSPLICGLDHLTTQAQQIAWKLAERTGATLDTTMTNQGRSSMFALQRVGKVTATLGEIASRSDTVLFWFCDPVGTHPRLLERLEKSNVSNRRVIVIDEFDTRTVSELGEYFHIQREKSAAVLATLRAMLAGIQLDHDHVSETTGLESARLESLLEAMTGAKYGSIFYGQTTDDSAFDLTTDSLACLIRELNNVTRFVGMKLRGDGNALSAENVLAWSSGYPFAINFARKYPRYNWLEHSAETVLTRGECDAVLFATGTDLQNTFSGLSRTAQKHLGSIPRIAISPIQNFAADVTFQVGIPGLNETGEFCRNDDVSMPLASAKKPVAVTARSVLDSILSEIS